MAKGRRGGRTYTRDSKGRFASKGSGYKPAKSLLTPKQRTAAKRRRTMQKTQWPRVTGTASPTHPYNLGRRRRTSRGR